jgi:hypothetical protein
MPVILHKYTKAKYGLSYLRDGFLRFSPLKDFNDPFEMHPYLDSLGTPEQIDEMVRELESEDEGFRRLSPKQKKEVLDDLRTNGLANLRSRMLSDFQSIGILSLVKNNHQDLLMWAHYADSHRGCVLEFDGTHEWFRTRQGGNPHDLMGVIYEVNYSPTRPQVSILALGRNHLLTKAECWGYEKEWRILLNLRDCSSKTILGDDGKEKVVNGLFQVPHEALTGVYLGVNMEPKNIEQFLTLLPSGDRVGLFQFRQDERDYSLVTRQLNL